MLRTIMSLICWVWVIEVVAALLMYSWALCTRRRSATGNEVWPPQIRRSLITPSVAGLSGIGRGGGLRPSSPNADDLQARDEFHRGLLQGPVHHAGIPERGLVDRQDGCDRPAEILDDRLEWPLGIA